MAPVDPLHLIGTTLLGKYAVENIVDDGGAALVYKANHTLWRRPVAIKVFRSLAPLPDDARERIVTAFLAETAELAKLSERTSAIVQARDVGQIPVDGVMVPFMVLEWIDGIPIDQLLDEETAMHLPPRDLGEAIFLMEPVVEALALAHKVGVYHRNIRPSKVVLLGDPRGLDCTIKLLDMGIADLDPERFTGEHPSPFSPSGEVLSRNTALRRTGLAADLAAVARLVRGLVQGTMPPPRSNDPGQLAAPGNLVRLANASSPMEAIPGPPSHAATLDLVCQRAEGEGEPFGSITDFWNALRGTIFLAPMSADGTDSTKRSLPPLPSAQLSSSTAEFVSAKTEFAPSIPPPSATAPTPKAAVGPSQDQNRRVAVSKVYLSLGLSLVLVTGTLLALRRTIMPPKAREGDPSSVASRHSMLATLAPSMADTLCPQDMVYVPEAEFVMGNQDPGSYSVERPAHKVRLTPFCLDRTEVTVSAYKECSDKGQCLRAGDRNESADIPAQDLAAYNTVCHGLAVGDKSKHPVNCVDWVQADAYCRYRGLRLPTEAEWEYAARGHESRTYPWGTMAPLPLLVNACGPECSSWASYHGITINKVYPDSDGFETTAPVGSFPKGASPFGALDMAGNVWEWVSDYFDKYTVAEAKNPQGPDKGTDRVIRGGGWNAPESGVLRATFRHHAPPTKRSHGIGFRCARDGSIAKATLP